MPKGKPANGRRIRKGERLAIIAATAVDPSVTRVARAFNVGENTVRRIIESEAALAVPDGEFDKAGRIFSTMLLSNAIKAQQNLEADSFDKMNPVQRAVFTKINIEASRLLREKPTSIHRHDSVTDLAAKTLEDLKKGLEIIDVEPLDSSGESVE
jgi:transposase-like protein